MTIPAQSALPPVQPPELTVPATTISVVPHPVEMPPENILGDVPTTEPISGADFSNKPGFTAQVDMERVK